MSADGTTVVGASQTTRGTEAFRWRAETGMVGLGDIGSSSFYSYATDVSGDGSVVIGRSGGSTFIWDEEHGMRFLVHLLDDLGVRHTGWHLSYPEGISDDGRTIIGWGLNPNREDEAWIAYLGPACPVDWDANGVLNSADFFTFLVDFFAGRADFDHSGGTEAGDFFAFLEAFLFTGC